MASFEDYLDTPEAFEALSDEDKVTLFNGGTLEGETSKEEISDTPAADETKQEAEAKEEEKESAADPVLLAKDRFGGDKGKILQPNGLSHYFPQCHG